MKRKLALLTFIFLLVAFILPAKPAHADGIIICDPGPCPQPYPLTPLVIKYHHVTVTIRDQVAVTHVDQVFFNPSNIQVEGTYIFPIPLDAAVNNFTLWVDGKPVEGQVLDAGQARQMYEDIVRNMRDPALLEYAGRGAVQARIFPIPPQGERRVELEYTQVLTADNGAEHSLSLVRYVYPLNTEKFSASPLESVTVNVDIRSSSTPIRAVYSPTHEVAISRADDRHVTAGYEAANVTPNTDFALYYSLGETEAFHLLTYRDPTDLTDPDGFFLLLLAPRPDAAAQALPKDILLVLDHSGSMEGEKFQQAQEALRYVLQHLNPEDRFNIVTFSTGVETYARNLRPAEEANEAIAWVNSLSAVGSTDINRALLEAAAMSDGEHPLYLIFLTDGLPTEGETDSQRILNNFASAPDNLRLFAFGVGYDVDTFLLDSLAQDHHGASTYIQPGDRLDETLSAFYARISMPVLTDLALDFGKLATYDIYPLPLPDLFAGSQIIVVGRYRDSGSTTVTLTGEVNGQTQTFRFANQVFDKHSKDATNAVLPRLWATRKIGHLLNQVRLNGPDQETIDQIVKLSIRYGIVTPYTSYLVTEEMPLGAAEQQRIANEQYSQMATAPAAPVAGATAVQKASDQSALAGAESVAAPSGEAADVVKIVGSRTFVLSGGVWVDTAFDPDTMQTTKVTFISDDYFALADSRSELAAAFALGSRVIALSDSVAYEVIDSDTPTAPIQIPPTLTPESPTTSSSDTPTPASPAFPCASGFLALLPIGVILLRRQKK
jgi:Ca-activated chloride channel family protein